MIVSVERGSAGAADGLLAVRVLADGFLACRGLADGDSQPQANGAAGSTQASAVCLPSPKPTRDG
jgi:hypothetical protein